MSIFRVWITPPVQQQIKDYPHLDMSVNVMSTVCSLIWSQHSFIRRSYDVLGFLAIGRAFYAECCTAFLSSEVQCCFLLFWFPCKTKKTGSTLLITCQGISHMTRMTLHLHIFLASLPLFFWQIP